MVSLGTPWKPLLAKAIERNTHIRESAYISLATVRSDGSPAVRTIVFRGFGGPRGEHITFCTDARYARVEWGGDWRSVRRLGGRTARHDPSLAVGARIRRTLWALLPDAPHIIGFFLGSRHFSRGIFVPPPAMHVKASVPPDDTPLPLSQHVRLILPSPRFTAPFPFRFNGTLYSSRLTIPSPFPIQQHPFFFPFNDALPSPH